MKQFLINEEARSGSKITLKGEEYHYLCRVRRLKPGAVLEVTDSLSRQFTAELTAVQEDSCELLIKEELESAGAREYSIHLYLCLCKGKKTDTMIRQAVEAGVDWITLVDSRFSQVKITGDSTGKFERWRKIIKEARQQSGSTVDTQLQGLIGFDKLPVPVKEMGEWGFFCHQERLSENPLAELQKEKGKSIHILIGSEGGLAQEEIDIMIKKGFSPLFLGYNVLRAETASIFALGTIITCMEYI